MVWGRWREGGQWGHGGEATHQLQTDGSAIGGQALVEEPQQLGAMLLGEVSEGVGRAGGCGFSAGVCKGKGAVEGSSTGEN